MVCRSRLSRCTVKYQGNERVEGNLEETDWGPRLGKEKAKEGTGGIRPGKKERLVLEGLGETEQSADRDAEW